METRNYLVCTAVFGSSLLLHARQLDIFETATLFREQFFTTCLESNGIKTYSESLAEYTNLTEQFKSLTAQLQQSRLIADQLELKRQRKACAELLLKVITTVHAQEQEIADIQVAYQLDCAALVQAEHEEAQREQEHEVLFRKQR